MTREEKSEQITELQDRFGRATVAIVTETSGMTVDTVQELRRARGADEAVDEGSPIAECKPQHAWFVLAGVSSCAKCGKSARTKTGLAALNRQGCPVVDVVGAVGVSDEDSGVRVEGPESGLCPRAQDAGEA